MKSKPANTAPKDGTVFLADMGWPTYVVCCWNAAENNWAYATHQIDMYLGEWNNNYFETEWDKEDSLKGWTDLPVLR